MRTKWKCLCLSFFLCLLFLGENPAKATTVVVGQQALGQGQYYLDHNRTFVPLRAVSELLRPGAEVVWDGCQARVNLGEYTLTAMPGNCYITANGRALYLDGEVRAQNGTIYVPLRPLSAALGAAIAWDAPRDLIVVSAGGAPLLPGDLYYSSDEVYWLSRIISAESRGEPLSGKIAVGNVILNRVANGEFPGDIYSVIFDLRWGGQFEPVQNGSIYQTPDEESVLAAKLCLEGANTAGSSLYFLNPSLAKNFWTTRNRSYITTIGAHVFYE